jgi:hypothetical protein
MAIEYPDVMNDLTDARLRLETRSLQYLAEFTPDVIAAGGVAQLVLTLQSTTDAPVSVGLDLSPPKLRGKTGRLVQAPFEIAEPVIRLTLQDGEVGQLAVPIRIHPQVPVGDYAFTARVESEAKRGAARTRPSSSRNQIEGLNIRYPQGLGITQIASWGYDTTRKRTQDVWLKVTEAEEEAEALDSSPRFTSVWLPQHWDIVAAARREVVERRPFLLSELTMDRVFGSMFQETPMWFSQSAVRMHVGETLLVAKMLTATVNHLLSDPIGQDCLLIPVLAYALANDQPTGDVLWLVTQLGYTHVLELAIASSFALVEDTIERQVWSYAEQRAARDFVVESLNEGAPLPAQFLYLPLILGGLVVAHDLVLDGEDVRETIGLIQTAKTRRADEFTGQEWRDLDDIFNLLVARLAGTQ